MGLLPAASEPYWAPRSAAPQAVESLFIIVAGLAICFVAKSKGASAVADRKKRGLPSVDPEALRTHDLANIIVLALVLVLNLVALVGYYRWFFVVVFSLYMVADFLWVWVKPECVPSPGIVLPHHIATLMLLAHPLRFPPHSGFAVLVTLVEWQTTIMVARRHFETYLARQPELTKYINYAYWPAAIGTRLLLHPWALYESVLRCWSTPVEMCLVSGILFLLVLLNIHFVTKEFKGGMKAVHSKD